MSTLKSINVQHPSATTINIVNDASGNVTVGNNLTVTGAATITGNVTGTWNGTAISVAKGGTGATSLTANNVILGNGTSAVQFVAPGANGNVLTSNGTTWASTAPASTASLTLLAAVATTSGTTVSVTGLATTYTNLLIILDNVGNSTGPSTFQIAASSNNGSSYGGTAGQSLGISANICFEMAIYRANASVTPRAIRTGNGFSALATPTAAPINALQFSWSGSYAFNAGTIYIYGWN